MVFFGANSPVFKMQFPKKGIPKHLKWFNCLRSSKPTKEDKTPGETRDIRIEIPMSPNQKKKEKRKRVAFWCGVIVFFLGITCCVVSFSAPSFNKDLIWGIKLWHWCFLTTTLLGGPVLSITINNLILFSIDREFLANKDAIYFFIALLPNAWIVLWFTMILLAWIWSIHVPKSLGVSNQNAEIYEIITLTLITILLGSVLWLVKDLLIMIGKSSFHAKRFFGRIKDSLLHEYRIKALMETYNEQQSPKCSKVLTFIGERNVCLTKRHEINLSYLETVNEETITCWRMNIFAKGIMRGRPLVNEKNIGDENVNIIVENEGNIDDEEDEKIAQKIFTNLARAAGVDLHPNIKKENIAEKGDNIAEKEIEKNIDEAQDHNPLFNKGKNSRTIDMDTMGKALSWYFEKEEADGVRKWLLEGADTKHIDEEVFKKCVIRARKFRGALANTLKDNNELFRKLNIFINVVLVIAIFILWLVMLNVEIRKAVVVAGSAIAGSAFIFGDIIKQLLAGFSYVFVEHPFDVGDCCLIEGNRMIIQNISILTTRVCTLNDEVIVYPNVKLCNLFICNYTRSPPCIREHVVFFIDIDAPEDKIGMLKQLIKSYIDENSHCWSPEHALFTEVDSEDSTKRKLTLRVIHINNFYEYQERESRKSKLISVLQKYLKLLGIASSRSRFRRLGFQKIGLNQAH